MKKLYEDEWHESYYQNEGQDLKYYQDAYARNREIIEDSVGGRECSLNGEKGGC